MKERIMNRLGKDIRETDIVAEDMSIELEKSEELDFGVSWSNEDHTFLGVTFFIQNGKIIAESWGD